MEQNTAGSEYFTDIKRNTAHCNMPVRKCAGFFCAKANFIVYPVGISVYFCYNE